MLATKYSASIELKTACTLHTLHSCLADKYSAKQTLMSVETAFTCLLLIM